MSYQLLATCPDELKTVLNHQMNQLGFYHIEDGFRAVSGYCDEKTFYKSHLYLTCASHLFRNIKTAPAQTPKILFSQASRIKWHKLFDVNKSFRVDGICGDRKEDSMPSNLISKMVREAIEDDFMHYLGARPKVDVKEPKVIVTVLVRGGKAFFSLCTSGKSLHKRGYRLPGHPAPIKETLAISLCLLAGYDGAKPLYDPFCGSGTIGIEAACLALDKSPLIHRKKDEFAFEHLKDFDRNLWRQVQDEAREERKEELDSPIYLSDISEEFVDLARQNALRARVEKHLHFSTGCFFENPAPCQQPGLIISNLPYGHRLEGGEDEAFFKALGDKLKKDYKGWSAWFLVHEQSSWKHLGLKIKRRIPILNGSINTKLIGLEIY